MVFPFLSHTWRDIFVQLHSIIGYLLIITLPSKSKIQSNIIEWRSRFCHFSSSHFCSNSTPLKLLSKQYYFGKYLWFFAAVEPDSIFKTFKSMYYIDLKICTYYVFSSSCAGFLLFLSNILNIHLVRQVWQLCLQKQYRSYTLYLKLSCYVYKYTVGP